MFGAQWRAVQREAQLAAEQIAHGITVLGRANHAQTGYYTQAFFSLSIGFERMGKLIFIASHAINNNGAFPTDQDLRYIGHDLSSLFNNCEAIGIQLDQKTEYIMRPNEPIHLAIENVLSLFAKKLRYYNLNHLSGADQGQQDPVAMWWEKVAVPICELHYTERQKKKDETEAHFLQNLLGDSTLVLHNAEDGSPIANMSKYIARGGATRVVQKYGRLYTMQIARWLTSIIYELSHNGAYKHRIEALLGLNEPFMIFLIDDKYMLNRKSWSIYA